MLKQSLASDTCVVCVKSDVNINISYKKNFKIVKKVEIDLLNVEVQERYELKIRKKIEKKDVEFQTQEWIIYKQNYSLNNCLLDRRKWKRLSVFQSFSILDIQIKNLYAFLII